MGENIYRKLIIRELKGETSSEESQLLDDWINESAENQKSYHDLWTTYQLTSPDVDYFTPDKAAAWLKIREKVSFVRERRSWVIQFASIAAAAVVFFLLGIAFQYLNTSKTPPEFLNQYSTVVVPEGQKSMIVLPDGSNVWLNSGTSLKYKHSFNDQIREVEIEGEAFFEVKKDKSKLFRVHTGGEFIEVYGTAFNVRNYAEEKKLEVTVQDGNVGIIRDGSLLADLTRGKQAEIMENHREVLLSDANVEVVTAWKNNELIFDDSPFEVVIRYLERWYGVKITIEEKMKKKHNYTFKIKTETLTELLKLLKVITPLEYKIDGKDVTIRYAK